MLQQHERGTNTSKYKNLFKRIDSSKNSHDKWCYSIYWQGNLLISHDKWYFVSRQFSTLA